MDTGEGVGHPSGGDQAHARQYAGACGTWATAYDPRMRISRFWALAEDEFGAAYAHSLAGSTHLAVLGGRTALEALEGGQAPRDVWFALCDAMDVPEERRHGLDKPPRP